MVAILASFADIVSEILVSDVFLSVSFPGSRRETSPVYGSPPSSDESTSLQAVLQVNLVLSRQVSEVFLL